MTLANTKPKAVIEQQLCFGKVCSSQNLGKSAIFGSFIVFSDYVVKCEGTCDFLIHIEKNSEKREDLFSFVI